MTVKRGQYAICLLENNERPLQEKMNVESEYRFIFKSNTSKAAFLSFLFLSTLPRERENHEENASFATT